MFATDDIRQLHLQIGSPYGIGNNPNQSTETTAQFEFSENIGVLC